MPNYRAIAFDVTDRIDVEIADSDTLNVGNLAPLSGPLTLSGSSGQQEVHIADDHDLLLGGTGALLVAGTGAHTISGGTFTVTVPTNLGDTVTLTGGQTITTTANGDITLDPHGTGVVNLGSDFYATGFDLGDAANRAGTLYADTLNANNIVGTLATCGTNCNVWQVNQDAVVGTAEYAGSVWLDGDGAANIEGWRARNDGASQEWILQYKQNPTDPSDLSEVWTDILTATPTSVTVNAPTFNATTINATTINGTFTGTVASCGTDCAVWEVNQDAAGGTAEDVGVALPAGDGVNVQNFQLFNDSSVPELVLRYKQNPTDPADFAEAGYTNILTASAAGASVAVNLDATSGLDVTGAALTVDANGIDSAGSIDLNGTLSFDSAGTIDTSGNNNLTLDAGTASVLATAGTVDLQTNVGTLDVPDQTGFSIGGTALTTTLWTATAVDTIYGGPASNADAYHTHSAAAVGDGTNSNVWQVNKDVAAGTQEYAGSVWLDGDGATSVEGWRVRNDGGTQEFKLQYKQDPTDPSDLTESWTDILTATPTAVTVNAPTFNATTINATTINGTFTGTIAACGTSCNVWEVNNDAAGGTPEDTGVALPAGDGVNVQNFQLLNDSSVPDLVLRYKQNPTDPADLAEAGYTNILTASSTQLTVPVNVDATSGLDVTGAQLTVDASGIDSAGSIDLAGTLSFDAAGTIDTSGNNNLTLDAGTASVLATAGTVDLQSNVVTLDVPDQTGFSIGGTALTTTLWTATAVDSVFGGPASNADAYHTHSGGGSASNQMTVTGLTTATVSQYYAVYISANNTVTHCDARDPVSGGSLTASTFAGVYNGVAGEIIYRGKVEVQFEAALTPAAGDTAFLSWSIPGLFTNVAPTNGSKDFNTVVGTILDNTNYAGTQRCVILISPDVPFQA
jgi:hypothetical protein